MKCRLLLVHFSVERFIGRASKGTAMVFECLGKRITMRSKTEIKSTVVYIRYYINKSSNRKEICA